MRIAVDAMGGDHAPQAIIAGALDALEHIEDDQLILFGDETSIIQHLGDASGWKERIEIVHTTEVVAMDEQPVVALRKKRKSSIAIMAQALAAKKVDLTISAGNTGAYVAISQMHLKLIPGVLRSGILVVFPTFAGPVVLCDVGANIAPKPAHLHQYALMSNIFAHEVVGIENPQIGIVSIGQEDVKGNELVKKTNQLLRDDDRLNFIGNIETRDFLDRPADVVICDGFVGNVILKLTEGLADGLFKAIKREITRQNPELLEKFRPVIEKLWAQHDYVEYGAAPLMGVNGTCLICHGSSDARAIKNAIVRARKQATLNINQKIADVIKKR